LPPFQSSKRGAARIVGLLGLLLALCAGVSAAGAQDRGPIVEVVVDRGLTPPAVSHVRRALREATAAEATALVINLRNGGGVLDSAWELARELAAADVPVVVWIGPGPVPGGPTGALLLAASDIAAMAPDSTAGFALPLASVEGRFSLQTRQLVLEEVVQESVAWQRDRGRNAEWIERAVRAGAIVDAQRARAMDPPVIDLVAADGEELVTALHGRTVATAEASRSLDTLGTARVAIGRGALEWLAQTLAVPTVAFLLFVLGAVAIYLEATAPGTGVPGVSGVVLVIAAFYGFYQAEVRLAAVLLLSAGMVLVGLEHVVMAHGGLTVAGLLLLVAGAFWLVDPARTPGLGVEPLAVAGTAGMLLLAVGVLVALAVRVRHREPVTGKEALIGQIAEVRQALDPEGQVFVAGALWSAWSDEGPVPVGDLVEIAGIENLRLYVRRIVPEPGSG
jgi:membrane-bound serine protease (ClpP class)